ncbi:hypothetical protein QOZ80_UnG0725150 [Eleusine coracana subsp. coracana]|uniref:Uncharacterized protein n=1 Tax=Eleusine coracana subsp. coracana TaxID=191504 RepID=A0AAV9G2Z1_ELECO|nr:hypothetical protein QOZ80_UnG0725150 [Eleusine coracana subsp. coracana]
MESQTLDVQVQRTLVIPAPATQSTEEVPFTIFDRVAPTYHVTVLFAFSPPNPTPSTLIAALAATLPRFPILTARIIDRRRARPVFLTGSGGAGALVVETAVTSPLADHLPLVPSPALARLHVPLDDTAKERPQLLQLQINRFKCGGLVVASSAHHQAADGYSMSTFFHAWVQTVRAAAGATATALDLPAVVPYGPGAIAPRRPPRCEFDHRGAEFKETGDVVVTTQQPVRVGPDEIANTTLHYTSGFVSQLKARASSTHHHKYTTFETVSAHLWRKITVARGRAHDPAATSLNVSVNGRARLPPEVVPKSFFGNVVLTAKSRTTATDLAQGSLADAAALVRAGVRAVDARYFQSFIDFGELHEDEVLEPAVGDEDYVLLPDVASDSWLHLELHKLDFGCGGRLVGVMPAFVPLDGVIVLMPSLHKDGGVDVFVALYDKHAKELQKIAYTMD